jgi:hypothetical protein
VRRLAEERAPDLDVMVAANLCWSAMQGLVALHETMTNLGELHGTDVPGIPDLAEVFTRMIVIGLLPR